MAEYGEIRLGDRVKHKISGFEGIATGITEYLQQCRQVCVQPETVTKDGSFIRAMWLDEPWLEVTKAGVHQPKGVVADQTGKIKSGAPDRDVPPDRNDE